MEFRQHQFARIALAPAKLNLLLEVLGRRGDGYHELQTLMLPVRLFDSLSLVPTKPPTSHAGAISLAIRTSPLVQSAAGHDIPTDKRNLVVRALELLRVRSGSSLGARVELVKRIPAAAGLGGGSGDAAVALRLANQAWELRWSRATGGYRRRNRQ